MAKSKSSSKKRVELPKGFKAIEGLGGSWDYKKQPLLVGSIASFKTIKSKFKDDNGKIKEQRLCNILTSDGEQSVWESAGTRALFELKKGTKVAIVFQGFKKIPGRPQPMKLFQVGVQ